MTATQENSGSELGGDRAPAYILLRGTVQTDMIGPSWPSRPSCQRWTASVVGTTGHACVGAFGTHQPLVACVSAPWLSWPVPCACTRFSRTIHMTTDHGGHVSTYDRLEESKNRRASPCQLTVTVRGPSWFDAVLSSLTAAGSGQPLPRRSGGFPPAPKCYGARITPSTSQGTRAVAGGQHRDDQGPPPLRIHRRRQPRPMVTGRWSFQGTPRKDLYMA